MNDTMTRIMSGLSNVADQPALRPILLTLVDRYSSQPLNTAGLALNSDNVTAKIGATDFYAVAQGKLVKIAAGTAMPALTGLNVTATTLNVFCFFVDSASVVTVAMGTEATTLAGITWPVFAQGKSLIGFFVVNYASTFTGGTTHLDTAGVVYINPLGPFDPSAIV